MFALFHSVPYEGESFLGVFSSLELAQAAGHAYIAREGEDSFYGLIEAFPCELDVGFRVAFGQSSAWIFAP